MRFTKKGYVFPIILLFSVLLSGCSVVGNGPAETTSQSGKLLQVHFLDVGQADSILITSPSGESILVDGGNNDDGPDVVRYLKSQGVKELAAVIATHPHEDHIGGLDTVIKDIPTKSVYMPNATANTQTFEDFMAAVKNSGAKKIQAKAGVPLNISGCTGIFLAPNKGSYEDLNNYSAVLKLTYGKISFLFEGDAEALSETEMLRNGEDLKSTVLKVGHHGSNSSTSREFLEAVSPQYAVISVGAENDYGHPSPTVIDRLVKAGVKVYRTDQEGTIVARTDGNSIEFPGQEVNDRSAESKPSKTPDLTQVENTVQLSKIDLSGEVATITNMGNTEVNLTGWKLVSEAGEQTYEFPSGTILAAGESLNVVSGKNARAGTNSLVWTQSNIWNNDGDPGMLYNSQGILVSKQ